MRLLIACGWYAAILATALTWADSASGFLLFGVGTVLLLDRHTLRLFPAPAVRRTHGLQLRAGCVLLATVVLWNLRPGVPLGEAVLFGTAFSLATFLLEALSCLAALALRLRGGHAAVAVRAGVILALLAVLAPLIALHPLPIVPPRTPASLGLAFEDVRFTTSDGVGLRGWLVPRPEARGNAIFCHGWGRNRGHVAGVLPTLHGLGLNVLAFDFRGHGESGGHTAAFGHRETADLLAAAAYLRQRSPGRPLFLVGISYGAAVALLTLPELPDVRAVWVEGCFSRLDNVVENYLRPVPAALRRPLARLCSGLAWLECGVPTADISPIEALRRVRVPVCFCHGENDDLVPVAEGRVLYDAYNGPKESFWAAGASHYDVRQRHRTEYLERLRSFFGRYLVAAGADAE
jgi:fermentation-respiration switch protein FrsA (DUF1100 family)